MPFELVEQCQWNPKRHEHFVGKLRIYCLDEPEENVEIGSVHSDLELKNS